MEQTARHLTHETTLSPAFHDLDPMDIVWHGNYVRYMEIARNRMMSALGYDYPQMRDSGYAWPIVDMRIKYIRPIRYGQDVRIRTTIVEWENRLKIVYVVTDAEKGDVLTRAHTIQVAVDMRTGEMLYVCPEILWNKLGVSPQ